jgi:branched-chain amino acid aminotransferase
MEHTAYFCGTWMPFSEVKIDPLDRGFLSGDVVFDVERTFNGRSFRMREHIKRLYRSLKYVRIDPGLSPEDMERISEETIERNQHLVDTLGDFTLWQFVTRGKGRILAKAGPPTVCAFIRSIGFSRFADLYAHGAHAIIVRTRSYPPDVVDAKVKNFSRMNLNLAQLEAADIDPHGWPLLSDLGGNLSEGIRYNLFIVADGVLRTPHDRSILQGVSRAMVLDLAKSAGIPVIEDDLQPYDLYTADEAFFTATSSCILPVTRADHREIGHGAPGPITLRLLRAWSEAVGLDIVKQALEYGAREA